MNNTSRAVRVTPASCQTLSLRQRPGNINHHLWFNNGCWWMHYTVHLPDFTKQRIRRSLRTKKALLARIRRDAILSEFCSAKKEAA